MRLSLCLISVLFLFLAASPRGASSLGTDLRDPAGAPGPERVVRAQYRMGTVLEIEAAGGLQGSSVEAALESAFAEVGRVEERLSNWRPESELSRANRSAGREPFPITRATAESLTAALALAGETGGAFDPTVGPITLERISGHAKETGSREVSTRLREIGYRRARVDTSAPTATLSFDSPRMSIDSGGFGKGEALDAAAAALRAGGIESARLNFGGQILVFGLLTPSGDAGAYGRAAVASPDDSGRLISRVVISDCSLSTSGDSQQPGHIIDPRTGRAAAFHGSATVLASSGVRADALSTALFVMGPAAGIAFAEARQIPALYVDAAGRLFASRSWSRLPSWTDPTSAAIAKRRTE